MLYRDGTYGLSQDSESSAWTKVLHVGRVIRNVISRVAILSPLVSPVVSPVVSAVVSPVGSPLVLAVVSPVVSAVVLLSLYSNVLKGKNISIAQVHPLE